MGGEPSILIRGTQNSTFVPVLFVHVGVGLENEPLYVLGRKLNHGVILFRIVHSQVNDPLDLEPIDITILVQRATHLLLYLHYYIFQ